MTAQFLSRIYDWYEGESYEVSRSVELTDQQAKELHDRLLKQMTEQAGINDELKAQNQMAWVQQMNAIDAQVREIVVTELIYQ